MARRKRAKGTRAPNGESSIYFGSDGKWHGRVTVGVKDDGSPDRRHVERAATGEDDKKAYNAVLAAVNELEKQRDNGEVRKAGERWKVDAWLLHWLEKIVRPSTKHKTYLAYRSAVHHHLIPGLGQHWMDKVQPDHFETLYAGIVASGRKPATAHQVHRTARTAWGVADKRGVVVRNPVALAKPPRVEEEEVEPYEIDDIRRLIKTALARRNGVRFVLALAIGVRQGETIGLKWPRLKDETRVLSIRRQLQRHTWQHGCEDAHTCGAKYHKTKPCPTTCKRHTRACPPPCPPDCASHARWCPQRHGGGLVEADVKSKAGRRAFVLPEELYELLVQHRAEQAREREHAGTEWHEGGWMFAQPNGRPIDPRRDWADWKALLEEAGVREGRLHDARHTAATVLLLLGVPERAVMDFMGWSNTAMATRYQHVTAVLRNDIAKRLSGFLWQEGKGGRGANPGCCPTCGHPVSSDN